MKLNYFTDGYFSFSGAEFDIQQEVRDFPVNIVALGCGNVHHVLPTP